MEKIKIGIADDNREFCEILVDFFGVNVVFILVVDRIPYLSEEGVNLCFVIVCPAELLLLCLLK